jgi:hypothetical protein
VQSLSGHGLFTLYLVCARFLFGRIGICESLMNPLESISILLPGADDPGKDAERNRLDYHISNRSIFSCHMSDLSLPASLFSS